MEVVVMHKEISSRRYYPALDLLRGFAALIVLVYHVNAFFLTEGRVFPGGFLCVDLFFLLSGFLTAAAHSTKIKAELPFGEYIIRRLARLYPLFFMATILGFIMVSLQRLREFGFLFQWTDIKLLFQNLLLLPNLAKGELLFPSNGPTWFVFFLFWMYILFFMMWSRFGVKLLLAFVVIGAVGVCSSAIIFTGLEVGWGIDNFFGGFSRALFSFFLGVLIFRSKIIERFRFRGRSVVCLLIVLMVMFHLRGYMPQEMTALFDLFAVFLIFPCVLVVCSSAQLSPFFCYIGARLGAIAYGVYLLTVPATLTAIGAGLLLCNRLILDFAPVTGFVFLPVFIAGSYFIQRFVEKPVNAWFGQKLTTLYRNFFST
jgi:peptidoglycan/LPS O-acetylase OafA/YrhL